MALDQLNIHSAFLGVSLALISIGALLYAVWHGINDFREKRGKPELRLDPIYIVILCLVGAVAAMGYRQFLWSGKPNAPIASSGNPLADQVTAYAAKQGKKAVDGAPGQRGSNFGLGDSSNGSGPFITSWGDKLVPWPTVADGFTAYQLRIFPSKRPAFKNDTDRRKLSEAVGALSDVVDIKKRGIITQTENVAGVWPIVARGRGKGAITVLEALDKIRADSDEVNAALYVGNDTIFDKNPPYKEDLQGVIPDELKKYWDIYQVAFVDFVNAMNLIHDVEPTNNEAVYNRAVENAARFQRTFVLSASDLRDRINLTSGRIVWMKKAI